jgi:hypothetical protein
MKTTKLRILGLFFLSILIYLFFFRNSINNSTQTSELSTEIFKNDIAKQFNEQENIVIPYKHNQNREFNNSSLPLVATPNKRAYPPVTISLLERDKFHLINLLKNKDVLWPQIRKQQAKIQMLKKKFNLPVLNHEKWPEAVLLYLIQKENYQIEEIDKAKSFADFNLSKKDIENLTSDADQTSTTKTNQ